MTQPTLGPFTLGECIGEGGMGRVYRAVHRFTGVDAAIKVISDAGSDDKTRRFHREIQSHAALVHPGIVYLFDSGVIDDAVAAQSPLVAGSPYVAMEFAEAGTVDDLAPIDDWSTIRSILIQTLDALAFAHARGVIHRDLKPENLLCISADEWLQIKLADFGIAHAFDDLHRHGDDTLQSATGTPLYMPPEQIRGRWRVYGPWTDLYALGCVAYELVCGHPPFVADATIAIALKHCKGERPEVRPQVEIPAGVEDWIHRAMAIDPKQRFRRAADAAEALPAAPDDAVDQPHSTGSASTDGGSPALAETLELTTLSTPTVVADTRPMSTVDDTPESTPETADSPIPTTQREAPPSWRRDSAASRPTRLIGTGTGLFGLRPTPFVDRDRERDGIWNALRRAVDDDALRLVVVDGVSGTGKSRLVRWMTERAHEVGVATVLRAIHTPGGSSPSEGLPGLIRRTFQAWRLSRDEFYEHLLEHLPALPDDSERTRQDDARALTQLVDPADESGDADGPRYQFENQRQKWVLLKRLLERIARRRTPVVWLDDLQWGSEAREWVQYLMDGGSDEPPALLLATLRSDVVAERPELADQIERCIDDERAGRLELPPLTRADHRVFIERLLPLEADLGDAIAARTEGNPLFAQHLLGDLIDGDKLTLGDHGFELGDGESLSLPDELHQLWTTRIDRLIGGLQPHRRQDGLEALELAAALGREVDSQEWRDVCLSADLTSPQPLLDQLIKRGLGDDTEEGWAFTHELLVDSIRRRARDANRWRTHHRRCATVLRRRHSDQPMRIARRLAEHWIEAGELRRALGPLLDESTRLKQLGAHLERRRVVEQRSQLIEELQLDDQARARLENELEITNIRYKSGQFQDLTTTLKNILQRCLDAGELDLASRAHQGLAVCTRHCDDPGDPVEYLERAIELARRADDTILQGKALVSMGWHYYFTNNYSSALDCANRAGEKFSSLDHPYFELNAQHLRATIHIAYSNLDTAQSLLEPVVDEATRWGLNPIEMSAANALGDLARYRNAPDEARQRCHRALDLAEQIDRDLSYGEVLINLSQVELLDGCYDMAERYLEALKAIHTDDGRRQFPLFCDYIALGLAAGHQQWDEVDRLLRDVIDWSTCSRDFGWILEWAGDVASSHGQPRRARRLLMKSRELWDRMECPKTVARIDDKLQRG